VVDLLQLVREIQVGLDVDGDSTPDLDPGRISYFGSSLGGIYGTSFVALERAMPVGVLNVAGGPPVEVLRLNAAGPFRGFLGQLLAERQPSLVNGGPDPVNSANPFPFRENLPLRNLPPVVNDVPGAMAIQGEIERIEWAMQSGDPVTYAPHLRKSPLAGVPPKEVLVTFAQGDPVARNTTTAAILRAGALADRTMFFRGLDAYAPNQPSAVDLHEFLFRFTPFGIGFALAGQDAVASFLASDGQVTNDPDGPGALFETPIAGPLPGELP
jgi:hypothetical protein